jgi:ubiquinone/menaquinone biosynthesis C-methylase UbiE
MNTGNELIDFFESGFYEQFWGWEFEEHEAKYIAEKSVELPGITSGHILDWCGGWGRISIHLAEKGFKITILDFVQDYLEKAGKMFAEKSLPLHTVNADCRFTPQEIQADHAICTFNSVGFLGEKDQIQAFQSLNNALKNNGKIIIDCINQSFLTRHFMPAAEKTRPDGIKCVQHNRFAPQTGLLHSDFRLIDTNGKTKAARSFVQRIYTPRELKNLLEQSGFQVNGMFGSFEAKDLSSDLPQIIAVAEKAIN